MAERLQPLKRFEDCLSLIPDGFEVVLYSAPPDPKGYHRNFLNKSLVVGEDSKGEGEASLEGEP